MSLIILYFLSSELWCLKPLLFGRLLILFRLPALETIIGNGWLQRLTFIILFVFLMVFTNDTRVRRVLWPTNDMVMISCII